MTKKKNSNLEKELSEIPQNNEESVKRLSDRLWEMTRIKMKINNTPPFKTLREIEEAYADDWFNEMERRTKESPYWILGSEDLYAEYCKLKDKKEAAIDYLMETPNTSHYKFWEKIDSVNNALSYLDFIKYQKDKFNFEEALVNEKKDYIKEFYKKMGWGLLFSWFLSGGASGVYYGKISETFNLDPGLYRILFVILLIIIFLLIAIFYGLKYRKSYLYTKKYGLQNTIDYYDQKIKKAEKDLEVAKLERDEAKKIYEDEVKKIEDDFNEQYDKLWKISEERYDKEYVRKFKKIAKKKMQLM